MAQPTAYTRQYDFTDYQTDNPSDPLPAPSLDAELNAVKQTLDQVLANLALIQRDDGELANNSVGADQLSGELSVGLTGVADWGVGVEYAVGNGVWESGKVYRCNVAHTSTVFATDLAAGKWSELLDLSGVYTDFAAAEAAATAAAASAVAADGSADAAAASAVAAAASAATATTAVTVFNLYLATSFT